MSHPINEDREKNFEEHRQRVRERAEATRAALEAVFAEDNRLKMEAEEAKIREGIKHKQELNEEIERSREEARKLSIFH